MPPVNYQWSGSAFKINLRPSECHARRFLVLRRPSGRSERGRSDPGDGSGSRSGGVSSARSTAIGRVRERGSSANGLTADVSSTCA